MFVYENNRRQRMSNVKPTESELEILNILWANGPSTVRVVHEIIEKDKPSKYTTTLKLLQIMLEKQLVSRDTSTKTHIYTAATSKEKTQGQFLKKMIDTMFNGSASQMVMQALGNHSTDKNELDAIKDYLKKIENENK